jgi:hypothetical protein
MLAARMVSGARRVRFERKNPMFAARMVLGARRVRFKKKPNVGGQNGFRGKKRWIQEKTQCWWPEWFQGQEGLDSRKKPNVCDQNGFRGKKGYVTPGTNWFFNFFRGKVGARNLKSEKNPTLLAPETMLAKSEKNNPNIIAP